MISEINQYSLRLARVERDCIRLRLWCIVLSVIAISLGLTSLRQSTDGVIRTAGIEVVGPDGLVRARLGGQAPMAPRGLVIYGKDGRIGAFMSVEDKADGSETSAAIRLASGGESPCSFSVVADNNQVSSRLMCIDHSVDTLVKEGSSTIQLTGPGEPMSEEWKAAHKPLEAKQDATFVQVCVVGQEPSILGFNSKHEPLFRVH